MLNKVGWSGINWHKLARTTSIAASPAVDKEQNSSQSIYIIQFLHAGRISLTPSRARH